MDSEAIEAKVKQIIMEKLNVEESEIVPQLTSLKTYVPIPGYSGTCYGI